jgi:hypothetical protein
MAESLNDGADWFGQAIALLQRRNDPPAFAHGTALLERAAAEGHPDAQCQLATLEATGVGRPQSWERALGLLQQAAAGGSDQAQAQLQLLAPTGAIRIDALMALPEREVLSETPRVRAMRGFVSPGICAWLVARSAEKLAPAMVWDESGVGRIDCARSNRAVELQFMDMDVVTAVVRTRISRATRLPEPVFEAPQVMHYRPGQEFKPHHDFLDSSRPGEARDIAARGQRIATFLIALNDGYEGGETDFPACGISWRGRTGDALFFGNVATGGIPDPLTLHAGRPPTSGEKWLFSQWIRDRSPAAAPPPRVV